MRFRNEVLIAKRKDAGLTLEALAKKLKPYIKKASHQLVNQWESGEHVPRAEHIFALCNIFKMKPNEWFK